MVKEREKQNRDHSCQHCGKVFTLKHNLSRHIRSHAAPAHKCGLCEKAFARPDALKTHQQLMHCRKLAENNGKPVIFKSTGKRAPQQTVVFQSSTQTLSDISAELPVNDHFVQITKQLVQDSIAGFISAEHDEDSMDACTAKKIAKLFIKTEDVAAAIKKVTEQQWQTMKDAFLKSYQVPEIIQQPEEEKEQSEDQEEVLEKQEEVVIEEKAARSIESHKSISGEQDPKKSKESWSKENDQLSCKKVTRSCQAELVCKLEPLKWEFGNCPIYIRDVASLAPGQNVTDDVVNYVLAEMVDNLDKSSPAFSREEIFLPYTTFWQILSKENGQRPTRKTVKGQQCLMQAAEREEMRSRLAYNVSEWLRCCKKQHWETNYFDKKLLMFPICLREHWVLGLVVFGNKLSDKQKNVLSELFNEPPYHMSKHGYLLKWKGQLDLSKTNFLLLDSFIRYGINKQRFMVFEMAKEFMRISYQKLFRSKWNCPEIDDPIFGFVPSIPQQPPRSNDCAMYMLQYCSKILNGESFANFHDTAASSRKQLYEKFSVGTQ